MGVVIFLRLDTCIDNYTTGMPNLVEIARLAKVSIATVSRTINRIPTVDPVLARRVWRVVEQVGYYPNTQARALVCGRSRIFGLIISGISNPFFSEIVETFTQLGIQHNYEILLSGLVQGSNQAESAARRMIERRVDGVAIITFEQNDVLIERFKNQNVPVFVIDAESPGPLLKTVQIDYQHGMRQAVQHLAALGHVRVAFVDGPSHLKTTARRMAAFEQCMHEIGLETPPELLLRGDHTIEAGMKALAALSALSRRPSAVVCSNDLTAIGVMRHAFELSIGIPRSLSVIGIDDIRMAQFMVPPLTTVQVPQIEIAQAAFAALLESVETECARSLPGVIQTNLVLRRTTALAPTRRRQIGDDADPSFKTERTRLESSPALP